MNGTLSVIARELQEWKRVFAAAFAAGMLVYLSPLLPGARSYSAMETMNTGAAMIATAFGFGVALIAGAGFIGRDLSERRLSFYFYKPLASGAIWSGKLLGALLLAFLSAILALVPVTLAGGGLLTLRDDATQRALALLAVGIVAIVVVANSFTLSFRARSPWVLMDFVAPLAITGLLAIAAVPLARSLAFGLITVLGVVFLNVFLLALLIAGYRGLSRGRTELREVHKVHALTVWPICAVAALGLIGYSVWVRSATPEDLQQIFVDKAAPAGPWIAVSGYSPARFDYQPSFLMNVDQGQSFRIRGGWTFKFSGDGKRVVWLAPAEYNPMQARLVVATLGDKPEIRETKIFTNPQMTSLAVSPDGKRTALISGRMLTVFDLASEKALGTVQLPEVKSRGGQPRVRFVSPQTVRVYFHTADEELGIFEFDPDKRILERTGSIQTESGLQYTITAQGHLMLRHSDSDAVFMYDGRTGERLSEILLPRREYARRITLSDGTSVIIRMAEGRLRLQTFSTSGEAGTPTDLGNATAFRAGGEVAPGKLLISISPTRPTHPQEFQKDNVLLMIDLNSGEVRKVAENLAPLSYLWWSEGQTFPGSVATKIFQDKEHSLVFFDPLTGERRALTGRNRG